MTDKGSMDGLPVGGSATSVGEPVARAPMFLSLLYRLRAYGVPVGAQEAVALAQGLAQGVHQNSVDGFYHAARSLLIHHEGQLDAFDRAFLAEFAGLADQLPEITEQLREWLDQHNNDTDPDGPDHLSESSLEELLEKFRERMEEQTERHDGGNYWIGTGGTSAFGQAGKAQLRFGGCAHLFAKAPSSNSTSNAPLMRPLAMRERSRWWFGHQVGRTLT